MRKTIAAIAATAMVVLAGSVSVSGAQSRPQRPLPMSCSYYTFNQTSTANDATIRTIVNVCEGQPICERRDFITANWQIMNLTNTCPAIPRR